MRQSEIEQESDLLFKTATNPDGTATAVIDKLEGDVKENGDEDGNGKGYSNSVPYIIKRLNRT